MSWTTAAAKNTLDTACKILDIDYQQLEILRFGTNAVYFLKPTNLVVRISRPSVPRETVIKEVAIMRWLNEHGFPTIAPSSLTPQPVEIYDSQVSVWPYIEHQPLTDHQAYGKILNQLHSVQEQYSEQLPQLDPFADIYTKLDLLKKMPNSDKQDLLVLKSWADFLAPRFAEQASELGVGMIHGDSHIGNCLLTRNNQPVMIDFDFCCYGAREWDLIPEALGPRRFNHDRKLYQDFVTGYGHDVSGWEGFQVYALTRELFITIWRMEVEGGSGVKSESAKRMQYWRREANPPVWSSF